MTIRQTKTYTPPAGHTTVVSLADWAETLVPEDKKECYTGIKYQAAREQSYIALNKLTINKVSDAVVIYEWDSNEVLTQCGTESLYKQYHDRYLQETGITLNITTETL
jgi:hypothetical protein